MKMIFSLNLVRAVKIKCFVCTDVLEASFLFVLILWEEYLKKNIGAKNFGRQGLPGMTSAFLWLVKFCFWDLPKQLVWLEIGHQVDQKNM